MLKLRQLTLEDSALFLDDPVRPHINADFRLRENRSSFCLETEQGEVKAVICSALCSDVPITEQDLDTMKDNSTVAVFYTVWSYGAGAGREIVFRAMEWTKENYPNVKRYVTLSPPTKMAEKFHLRNGAIKLQDNQDTVNFEYI